MVLAVGKGERFRLFVTNVLGNVPGRVGAVITPKDGDDQTEKLSCDKPLHAGAKTLYHA